jgi:hypothetical protein
MRLGRFSLVGSTAFGAALLGVALSAAPAHAQTDEQRSGARAAATAGAQAFMAHKWAESIDMFTRAESLIHSPVHLLYMARAYEKLGALVKARESYIKIQNEELPAGAPQPLRQAKADAEKELEALEPRVPYVSVVVQGAGPKPVTVTMDGIQVPAALLGVPRPVDPGEHKFEALAEGMDSALSSLTVREGHSETVVLTLHASTAAPLPPPGYAPGVAPVPPPPVGYAVNPTAPPAADTGHKASPLPWIALGVGAVGLGVGTVFAVQASSKVDDANSLCTLPGPDGTNTYCPSRASALDDEARTAKTISIVGFVVGGLGVATGVTLLVLAPKHEGGAALGPRVAPWVGLGSAGVRGRF